MTSPFTSSSESWSSRSVLPFCHDVRRADLRAIVVTVRSILADEATLDGRRQFICARIDEATHLVAEVGKTDAEVVVGEPKLTTGAVMPKATRSQQGAGWRRVEHESGAPTVAGIGWPEQLLTRRLHSNGIVYRRAGEDPRAANLRDAAGIEAGQRPRSADAVGGSEPCGPGVRAV